MAHTLTNYNGMQIVTPEDDLSADRQALNENFKTVADGFVRNPMTASLDAGGFDITDIGTSGDNPALAVNAGAITSLDGGAITTDGSGNINIAGFTVDGSTMFYWRSSPGGDIASDSALVLGISSPGSVNAGDGTGYFCGLGYDGTLVNWRLYGDKYPVHLNAVRTMINPDYTSADDGVSVLQVINGPTSLDGGAIKTDGSGDMTANSMNLGQLLQLTAQSSPPTPVAGGIYFDGANFNFCSDGSTWVALTLP